MPRFDLQALYEAVDEQRITRGLSWQAVSEETGVSASTLKRTAQGGVMEADGVLAMTVWVGKRFSSFANGAYSEDRPRKPAADRHARFDTRALFEALDQQRKERALSWQAVADAVGGVSVSMLTGLAKGGWTTADLIVAVCDWLGRLPEDFVRSVRRPGD